MRVFGHYELGFDRYPMTVGSARMPHRVEVRFIAGLNDLLPPGRGGRPMTIEGRSAPQPRIWQSRSGCRTPRSL